MSATPTVRASARARAMQLEYPMSLGVFDDYEGAQRAVDYLSDHEFPVQNVMIVGTELKQVERVTGRLTTKRVLLGGVMSGAWMGLFVGLIFSMFDATGSASLRVVSTVGIGALFGLVWAWIGYGLARGQRDFTSISQVIATKYEVLAEHKVAAAARELLAQLDPTQALQQRIRAAQAQAAQKDGLPGQ